MSIGESPNMHVNPDACLTILPFFYNVISEC